MARWVGHLLHKDGDVFEPWDPHKGDRKELTLQGCPLTPKLGAMLQHTP